MPDIRCWPWITSVIWTREDGARVTHLAETSKSQVSMLRNYRNLVQMEENGVNYEAVAYTSGIENQPEVIRHVANRKRLLGNPAPVVEAARDFKRVHHLLQKVGVSYPRTLYHWRSPPPPGDWLCKPLDSGEAAR